MCKLAPHGFSRKSSPGERGFFNAFCLSVVFKRTCIISPFVWEKAYQFLQRFVPLCAKAPGMQSAFASPAPSASTPVDHKPIKIWKGGIIARGPMWFLAERGLFSLGDVMGICKICSAVIHCFDSFHWPFLVSVILCVGRSCGLFLAFPYSTGSFLALAWCPVEMLRSLHRLWVPVPATKAELCSTQTPLVPVSSSPVGLKADSSL